MKVIIVGGVAGGASAAARLRRLDENAEIVMIEKGEHISFANCGLPYYIGGTIENREDLLIQTPQSMGKRFNLDIRVWSEVIAVHPERKMVTIREVQTGKEYQENYDKLILSPGAKPIKPSLPGIESEGIFTLRNVKDVDFIKAYITQKNVQKAVVVGGGFIGIEMAENLVDLGVKVDLVELSSQVMAPVDPEMAVIVENKLMEYGVKLHLGTGVVGFEKQQEILVKLNNERVLNTDMVLLAIGVRPDIDFLNGSGIEVGDRGGIVVNETLQTSNPDIYAVGDAVEVKDLIHKGSTMIPLAGPANRQGRMAADHICGKKVAYKGTQGTSVVKVFDYTLAATGNNEKMLKKLNIPYKKVYLHPGSHAGYYPGAAPITMKLLFDSDTGKVLGAQAVGLDGVEKRIDVLATAIRAEMTVYDLQELELAYAPPFSSAKDPVNMAGYLAVNLLEGMTEQFYLEDIQEIEDQDVLLDLRTSVEYQHGHILRAVNIPVDELRNRLDEIDKDKNIYVYCQVGIRGFIGERILKQSGFKNVKNLSGGYRLYSMVQKPKENMIYQDKLTSNEQPDIIVKK